MAPIAAGLRPGLRELLEHHLLARGEERGQGGAVRGGQGLRREAGLHLGDRSESYSHCAKAKATFAALTVLPAGGTSAYSGGRMPAGRRRGQVRTAVYHSGV